MSESFFVVLVVAPTDEDCFTSNRTEAGNELQRYHHDNSGSSSSSDIGGGSVSGSSSCGRLLHHLFLHIAVTELIVVVPFPVLALLAVFNNECQL